MKTENKILELTFDFALKAIELYKILVEQKEFVISKQFLRSSTSIGAIKTSQENLLSKSN